MKCFRVLDVREECLKKFFDQCLADVQYVVLTYVWGKNQQVKLLLSTKDNLAVPGSLERLQLPQTLTDALQLVELLGFRYLWVDVLCIVQDDIEDTAYQISRMAAVHLNASLAVAVAAGLDCEAGLPGLRPGTPFREQQEVVVVEPSDGEPGLAVLDTLKSVGRFLPKIMNRNVEDIDLSVWRGEDRHYKKLCYRAAC